MHRPMNSNGGARHGAEEPTSFGLQPPNPQAAVPHPGNPYATPTQVVPGQQPGPAQQSRQHQPQQHRQSPQQHQPTPSAPPEASAPSAPAGPSAPAAQDPGAGGSSPAATG